MFGGCFLCYAGGGGGGGGGGLPEKGGGGAWVDFHIKVMWVIVLPFRG